MAHFSRVIEALLLKNKQIQYQTLREHLLTEDYDEYFETEKDSLFTKLNAKWKFEFLRKYLVKIEDPNTIEHFVAKSFLGFISGVFLTYIFFFFLYLGVNLSLRVVTYICGLGGIFLCLGLAYSSKIRCYVLLVLPVFFTREGRQALLAYILFLAFTGPAQNTMHNIGILSNSMSCGQEMVKGTLKQIFEMVKAPFRSVKETLDRMKKALTDVIETVKAFVEKIKRIIVNILNVIKKATSWLGSIISFCNKKVGTPFQRCMKTLNDAIADCKAKLGVMDFLCHIVHVVKGLCYTVKWLDFICMFTDFVSDKVVNVVKRKLKEFSLQMKTLFYVSIEINHSYEFETSASNSTKQIARTIFKKIASKIEKVQVVVSLFGFMFSFLFLFVFIKVYYYRYKFLTSDRYDNIYISNYTMDLDLKRAKLQKETVLPLEPRERKKYAKPSSLRLLRDEKRKMTQSMFLISLTTFKIISFLACDYCLFWVLLTIYEAGKESFEENEKSSVVLRVQGKGVLSNFYRKLGKSFRVPENPDMQVDPLHCLPDPVTPDTGRYFQIGFLLSLCWFLTFTEPYGLRLRNIVMSYYYPDRARERAVWLYNHILRSRGSFLRFARRQLRKKFQKNGQQSKNETVTFKQKLFAHFPILVSLFGRSKENICILCGQPETEENPLKQCKTPDCPGKYCLRCFGTLQNTCTICQNPIEYGDISDISDEIDSSDEEYYKINQYKPSQPTTSHAEDENFMTFKDLQLRDRFKDVESNKKTEYAKVKDLLNENIDVRSILKNVLKDRINQLKKNNRNSTKSDYASLKTNLEEVLQRIKRKKLKQTMKKDKQPLKSSLKSSNSSTSTSSKKGRVTFQIDESKELEKNRRRARLTKDLRAKLNRLKMRKKSFRNLHQPYKKSENSEIDDENEKNGLKMRKGGFTNLHQLYERNENSKIDSKIEGNRLKMRKRTFTNLPKHYKRNEKSDKDNEDEKNNFKSMHLRKTTTYYFIECEKNYGVCHLINPQIKGNITRATISLKDYSNTRKFIL